MILNRFEVELKHGAFYTGGNVEWHDDKFYCQTVSTVSILDLESGTVVQTVGDEDSEDADVIVTFSSDGLRIVTAHKSGLLKLWNSNGELEKMWKSIHKGPVAKLSLMQSTLASGGSDGSIRIWDLDRQSCSLNLKGAQGVVNVARFHPAKKLLFGSGSDGKINSWNLDDGKVNCSYDGHFSKVTSLSFHQREKYFVSCGRDKVVILWEYGNGAPVRTVPTYETLESVICLPKKFKIPNFKSSGSDENIYVATAGDRGVVRVWDVTNTKELHVQSNPLVNKAAEDGGLSIVNMLYNEKSKTLAVVSAEHVIVLHKLKTFECTKQFIGFSDELFDVIYMGDDDKYLAVATNSKDIKLYENATMNCKLLKGHTDLVLALGKSSVDVNLMASSGKDNTVRLWRISDGNATCVGVGSGHTASVGSVSFNCGSSSFLVSGSQDTCVKIWEIPTKSGTNAVLKCLNTERAHQKDINCVSVAPNDKIIATASQDKTVRLWNEHLVLLGTLQGHRRGVWSAKFSPVDQVVITSSADCTVKLWSISEFSCLKTFEGHESSVLRVEFISNGMQFISVGSDGLVKLFNLKTSVCTSTFEHHDGRVWALALSGDETRFVTGGSDSTLIKWRDVTEEKKLERSKEQEQLALDEQQLQNYVQSDQLLKALKFALRLEKPLQVLRIVQGIVKRGDNGLSDTIAQLRDDQKDALLKCVANWNTNGRNCQPAQLVLNILINELQSGKFRPTGLSHILEGSLPYTERHFKRLTQLMKDLYFITYTINCMQPHAKTNV